MVIWCTGWATIAVVALPCYTRCASGRALGSNARAPPIEGSRGRWGMRGRWDRLERFRRRNVIQGGAWGGRSPPLLGVNVVTA
eukprot:1361679-Prymnesium_polylepis.1